MKSNGKWYCHDCRQYVWVRSTNQFLNPPVCGLCDGGSLEYVSSGRIQEEVCQKKNSPVKTR